MVIWKYALEVEDEQSILMPCGARLLCVQVQNEQPCLWALVDPGSQREFREIYTVGTGCSMPAGLVPPYVGTYQLRGGSLVFHVFG